MPAQPCSAAAAPPDASASPSVPRIATNSRRFLIRKLRCQNGKLNRNLARSVAFRSSLPRAFLMNSTSKPAQRQSLADARLRKHADYLRAYAAGRKRQSAAMSWFLAPQTPASAQMQLTSACSGRVARRPHRGQNHGQSPRAQSHQAPHARSSAPPHRPAARGIRSHPPSAPHRPHHGICAT